MSNEALYAALSLAQSKIEGAKKKNLNPHFKSRYADLASVWDACRDELTEQGLSVFQFPVTPQQPGMHVALLTVIAHKSGQEVGERFELAIKDPTNPQAVGSALTYMRRYALMGAVGIAPEDDDANAATAKARSGPPPLPAAGAKATDWTKASEEILGQLRGASDDTEKRKLYGTVRASDMDEPQKTALLFKMAAIIKGTDK